MPLRPPSRQPAERPDHGTGVVDIGLPEPGDQLAEVLALGRTEHVRPAIPGAMGWKVPFDLVQGAQDPGFGQDTSQSAMHRLQPIQRLVALRIGAQTEPFFPGNRPQVLRQPLLFQRGIARAFAHPGQQSAIEDRR